jgi:hypothetical protein
MHTSSPFGTLGVTFLEINVEKNKIRLDHLFYITINYIAQESVEDAVINNSMNLGRQADNVHCIFGR